MRGIPHAVLVDPSGTVVWKGNPALLTDAEIELTLPGALTLPRWRWPEGADEVEAALRAGELPRALSEAQRLARGGDDLELVTAIRRMIDGPVEAIRQAYQSGDYPFAKQLAERIGQSHQGTPAAAEASAYLDRIEHDPKAQAVLALDARLEKLQAKVRRVRTVGEARALVEELDALASDGADTVVAAKAQAAAEALRAQIRRSSR